MHSLSWIDEGPPKVGWTLLYNSGLDGDAIITRYEEKVPGEPYHPSNSQEFRFPAILLERLVKLKLPELIEEFLESRK